MVFWHVENGLNLDFSGNIYLIVYIISYIIIYIYMFLLAFDMSKASKNCWISAPYGSWVPLSWDPRPSARHRPPGSGPGPPQELRSCSQAAAPWSGSASSKHMRFPRSSEPSGPPESKKRRLATKSPHVLGFKIQASKGYLLYTYMIQSFNRFCQCIYRLYISTN